MKEAGLEAYRVSKRDGKRGEGEWYWIKKHKAPDMPGVPEASTLGPLDHLDGSSPSCDFPKAFPHLAG